MFYGTHIHRTGSNHTDSISTSTIDTNTIDTMYFTYLHANVPAYFTYLPIIHTSHNWYCNQYVLAYKLYLYTKCICITFISAYYSYLQLYISAYNSYMQLYISAYYKHRHNPYRHNNHLPDTDNVSLFIRQTVQTVSLCRHETRKRNFHQL